MYLFYDVLLDKEEHQVKAKKEIILYDRTSKKPILSDSKRERLQRHNIYTHITVVIIFYATTSTTNTPHRPNKLIFTSGKSAWLVSQLKKKPKF
jgi:hypothetical protein